MSLAKFHLRFGLRAKLLLLSSFLFTIPWLGYEYVWEMEKYLRQGQEKTLVGTVRAVATALHERPKLFDSQASFLPDVKAGRDLYAYPIVNAVRLDGELNDWPERQHAIHYAEQAVLQNNEHYSQDTLSFEHLVGKYNNYLYAYFKVTDDVVTYRQDNSLSVTNNDYLQFSFINQEEEFKRYLISTKQAGWITPYEILNDISDHTQLRPEAKIQGVWKQTTYGYNVELRIPLDFLGSQLSFAVSDVDLLEHQTKVTIGTSDINDPDKLGTILVPSPEIEKIIKALGHTSSRIWVIDQHQRVLASSGDIQTSDGIWTVNKTSGNEFSQLLQSWLQPLYDQIITKPPAHFIDELYDVANLQGKHIDTALNGKLGSNWRLTADKKAVVLAAAHPIFVDQQVLGAVIAEETTNGIRTIRNQALEKLFNVILAIMGIGTSALFIFASRISFRIRKLRDQTEQSIDEQGRIKQTIVSSKVGDEIGDLQRSFVDMVNRLGQYNHYLEGMSSRLSHELRTPVAVVRSSLETLAMENQQAQDSVYMQRATDGINRLSTILTNMSEATRLEQSLQQTELVEFDICQVVSGCIEGYRFIYPESQFDLTISESSVNVKGGPELIAQLLDKLIANAVEFAQKDTAINISLNKKGKTISLDIFNQGPNLPDKMADRIFDSMVSVRSDKVKQNSSHLGIGLYIARLICEFHKGSISAENQNHDNNIKGVNFKVSLPST